jgi:hypothetical protein
MVVGECRDLRKMCHTEDLAVCCEGGQFLAHLERRRATHSGIDLVEHQRWGVTGPSGEPQRKDESAEFTARCDLSDLSGLEASIGGEQE